MFPPFHSADFGPISHSALNNQLTELVRHDSAAFIALRLQHLILAQHFPKSQYFCEALTLDPAQGFLYEDFALLPLNAEYTANKMDPFTCAIGEVGFLLASVTVIPGAADDWLRAVFHAQ